MTRFVTLLLLLVGVSAFGAHVEFNLSDFTTSTITGKVVRLTPLSTPRVNGAYVVSSDRISTNSGLTGSVTISNVVYGNYTVELLGPYKITEFTILVPDTNISLNVTGLITSTISVPPSGTAYSQTASDARYALRASGWTTNLTQINSTIRGLALPGYNAGANKVWTCTNATTGQGQWVTSSGGGGGGDGQFYDFDSTQFTTNTDTPVIVSIKNGAALTNIPNAGWLENKGAQTNQSTLRQGGAAHFSNTVYIASTLGVDGATTLNSASATNFTDYGWLRAIGAVTNEGLTVGTNILNGGWHRNIGALTNHGISRFGGQTYHSNGLISSVILATELTTASFTLTGGTPASGKVLVSDGSGVGTWSTTFSQPPPPGNDTEILFNDGGTTSTDSGLKWSKNSDILTIVGDLEVSDVNMLSLGAVNIENAGWLLQHGRQTNELTFTGTNIFNGGWLENKLSVTNQSTLRQGGAAYFSNAVDIAGAATAPTPAEDDNDTSIATTAYVQTEIATFTGTLQRQGLITGITNSATETDILNYTIPGGLLGTNKALRITLGGRMNSTTAGETNRTRIKLGGTTIYEDGTTTSITGTKAFTIEFTLQANNSQAQESVRGIYFVSSVGSTTGYGDISTDEISGTGVIGAVNTIGTDTNVLLQVTIELLNPSANHWWERNTSIIELK